MIRLSNPLGTMIQMPLRALRLSAAHSNAVAEPFICLPCRYRRALSIAAQAAKPQSTAPLRTSRLRKASTLSSVTTVNASKQILPAARDLYEALGVLKEEAGVYTSLIQLQLALKGLESQNAVTKVALIGANGLDGVKRLARVLLADPLAPESEWEKRLVAAEHADERAVLLRYEDNDSYDGRHPLLRQLGIPAPVLRRNNLEILVQAISPTTSTNTDVHALLTPNLELAPSPTARYAVVTNAMHKALVYSEGLQNLPVYTPVIEAEGAEKEMVKGAINIRDSGPHVPEEASPIVQINIERAEAALQTIRNSLDNSIDYEQLWFSSGLPALSSWLQEGTASDQSAIKPTVQRLIESLLSITDARIRTAETEHLQRLASTAITPTTRSNLSALLAQWSENAHTELRDQLDVTFDSPSWRKLAWWKLPWRVDDVAMIAADVLQRSFLTRAEKELAWLVGRIEQAGLYVPPVPKPTVEKDTTEGEIPPTRQSALITP
ncbi:MAG: hypothetical protein Q9191_003595, partial [Dirinaria sp. TL-2023a]